MMMLEVKDLSVYYGAVCALSDASMEVHEGEIVTIIGGNGSGKSTLLKGIAGVCKPASGTVRFLGEEIQGVPAEKTIKKGLAIALANHVVFPNSTVYSNLEAGAYIRKDRHQVKQDIEGFLERFPNLERRKKQKAGLLSGGEQQLLSIARALMSKPKLLLLDEPSIGLAPLVLKEVFDYIKEISRQGVTMAIVEQNARMALSIADRGYLLANGKIVLEGDATALRNDDAVKRAYFGA